MRDREKKTKKSYFILLGAFLFAAAFFVVPRAGLQAATFTDQFNEKCSLSESANMEESASADWWINSGGKMKCRKGVGMTLKKSISPKSKWRKLYKKENSEDTDKGKHPQNIFRLLTKSKWQNFSQEAQFKIKKFNLSKSENRNESNGILLMSRYQDADNLYYAGVRVDGYAVIKKKTGGDYYTMAYSRYYGKKKYSRKSKSRSHLLPRKKWIGLKTEVRNIDGGKVEIKLYVMQKNNWALAAEAIDEPGKYGGDVLGGEGYAGIRTDFMDVEFDKLRIFDL